MGLFGKDRAKPAHGHVRGLVVCLVALVALLAGVVIGWLISGRFAADWVGAIGQWVGGLGTIATLMWAVLVFRQEKERENRDRDARETAAEQTAGEISCTSSASYFTGGVVRDCSVVVRNPTTETVIVKSLQVGELPEYGVPFLLGAGKSEARKFKADIERFSSMPSVREFNEEYPVTMMYEIGGRLWRRVGEAAPERQ